MAIEQQAKEFNEKVIAIDRVARVVKGGRRFRFRATVVVGDGNGRVGVGVGKGQDVMSSIAKAVATAKRHMITVPLRDRTIPHQIQVRFAGAEVMLKPASAGTGVIAGGAVRNVVEAAGIHDLLSKSFGSSNKINNAYATIMALAQLTPVVWHTKSKAAKAAAAEPTVEAKEEAKEPKAATKAAKTTKAAKPKKATKKAEAK